VLAGDDLYLSPLLALGADGAIQASAHVRTAEFARVVRLWRDGQAVEARALGHRLAPLSAALFAAPNPTVIKAVLHRRGEIPSPAVRLPLVPASQADADVAERLAA
jgi:4-hydroxy-tetrahydrodipicolinate synthase